MRVILPLLLLCNVAAAATHPLDPLNKDEISLAVSVLKHAGKATAATRFPVIVLNEQPACERCLYSKPCLDLSERP